MLLTLSMYSTFSLQYTFGQYYVDLNITENWAYDSTGQHTDSNCLSTAFKSKLVNQMEICLNIDSQPLTNLKLWISFPHQT